MTDKGRILTFPDMAAIEAEAAAWVARFDAGEVSAKEQAAFQEWLNRSALHRESIAEFGDFWSEFDALRLLTNSPEAGRQTGTRDDPPSVLKRARPWFAACAAVVIVAAGGLLSLDALHPAKPPSRAPVNAGKIALVRPAPPAPAQSALPLPERIDYETAVGGQKKIALADGSSVILNTNSRLKVDFSANRRNVYLTRGEAYFEVIHDKTRPFRVYANNYVVRDIGTAFDVHLSKTGLVEVGVTKGSVEVKPAKGGQTAGAAQSLGVLTAGHDIVLGRNMENLQAVTNADLVRKLAWRQGQLIYSGQPLREVLDDVGRYSDIKIDLADPALANLPVGGAFRTDQIEAIFAALENNFGVHAEWLGPQHVRFTSGREKPAAGN